MNLYLVWIGANDGLPAHFGWAQSGAEPPGGWAKFMRKSASDLITHQHCVMALSGSLLTRENRERAGVGTLVRKKGGELLAKPTLESTINFLLQHCIWG